MRGTSLSILLAVVTLGCSAGIDPGSIARSQGVNSVPAASSQSVGFATSDSSGDIEWSDFEWRDATIGGRTFERGAVLVPVRLKGNPKTFWMQLDTGSDVSVAYGIPLMQLECPVRPVEGQEGFVGLSGTLGSCPFDSLRFFMREDFGDSLSEKETRPVIGTIGQDFLVEKVLLLDFVKARFYLADSTDGALRRLLSRASFVDLERRNNKLFVPVQIGEVASKDFFFDTGASLFPITTSKQMWQKLTGRKGTESSNVRVRVSSWGQEVVLIGAPAKGMLRFGELQVEHPMAYFDSTGSIDFSNWPFKTDGLLGNALFYHDFTVVLDLQQNRFGILKSE
ncbi:MAG: hypothetical protein NTX17_07390 [Candidatus Eisenbacteria bacterium]|nr:hypothetical protein [Candidatus Eisenbacteria bacterium]